MGDRFERGRCDCKEDIEEAWMTGLRNAVKMYFKGPTMAYLMDGVMDDSVCRIIHVIHSP